MIEIIRYPLTLPLSHIVGRGNFSEPFDRLRANGLGTFVAIKQWSDEGIVYVRRFCAT